MLIEQYLQFWMRMVACALTGGRRYYIWLGCLALFLGVGVWSYIHHVTEGLVVTNMTDQVSWGIGIANFVYFVGVAAAAAILVFPAYVLGRKDIKEVVLIGELLAVVAVVMCLLFIVTDIGRPERLLHLIPAPGLGMLNLPDSLLAWDVVVFNGYLAMNMFIPGYLLWKRYLGNTPTPWVYLPIVFISAFWAVSIHTVTAFLLSGLGSRPFWNTAILAPRFLISAGASGPALLIIIFSVVRAHTGLKVKDSVFEYLKAVLRVAMPVNLFLLGCEVFLEFYTGTLHSVNAHYLYFGIDEHKMLPKFIWPAMTLNFLATTIFLIQPLSRRKPIMYIACGMTLLGIWTEKGMGLIFPGFTPSPLGEVAEYAPNLGEIAVSIGVLSLGAMLVTFLAKVAAAIQSGELRLYARETPWLEAREFYARQREGAHEAGIAAMGRMPSRPRSWRRPWEYLRWELVKGWLSGSGTSGH